MTAWVPESGLAVQALGVVGSARGRCWRGCSRPTPPDTGSDGHALGGRVGANMGKAVPATEHQVGVDGLGKISKLQAQRDRTQAEIAPLAHLEERAEGLPNARSMAAFLRGSGCDTHATQPMSAARILSAYRNRRAALGWPLRRASPATWTEHKSGLAEPVSLVRWMERRYD